MDADKLRVLKEVEYSISKMCRFCVHAQFRDEYVWGTCAKYTYEHQKHTEQKRQLSIYVGGSCKEGFELDPGKVRLGGYEEFLV